ncbi:MAG: aminotransferase class IV [Phycisphaerae bacterium]
MPEIAYVNGRFCPIDEAVISINDRGFQFADSVYEVVAAYEGAPFRLQAHLDRLRRSLSLIDMEIDERRIDFAGIIREGIARAGFARTLAYLQVTRGVQARSHLHSADLAPTVVATFRPKPEVDPAARAAGISVVTVCDTRRVECEIKATALLANVLALNRARRKGYDDAIFVSPAGEIREGTASNVFVVRHGMLMTPVCDASILHGVTRQFVLECARRIEHPVRETRLTVADLQSADEAFFSSTTQDILAVTRVNRKPIGSGGVGPVTERLCETFLEGLGQPLEQ